MKQRKRRRGLTLVEILFATAILALCLTAVFRAYMLAIDGIKQADPYSRAVVLGRELMDRLADEAPAAGMSAQGEFENSPGITWDCTCVPVEWQGQPLPGLVEARVNIRWPKKRGGSGNLSYSVYLRRE